MSVNWDREIIHEDVSNAARFRRRTRAGMASVRGYWTILATVVLAAVLLIPSAAAQTIAVRGKTIHTMGPAGKIADGVVLIENGKITAVGPAASVQIPAGTKVIEAAVVTPGLVDAHSVVGLSGILNYAHDQEQLERSAPVQPELRAIDAYNPQDPLIEWVRSFGVTTLHTGHAPGELISGQTCIVKTVGNTVDAAVMVETAAVAATVASSAIRQGKSPGTRGKMMAMLRAELLKAREYVEKRGAADSLPGGEPAASSPVSAPASAPSKDKTPSRDLRQEALARVLKREAPLLVTAHRAQDIASVLRLAKEFDIRVWLDGACESYVLLDEIKAAGVPVIVHPTMTRAFGETENLSVETAAKLRHAGVAVALQSGYESYVPKTRVVLFEAAMAAANGLSFDEALATITIDAARLLGIDGRVGSLEVGKDGDVALYDGDPFEYTSHCVGVVIDGRVTSDIRR